MKPALGIAAESPQRGTSEDLQPFDSAQDKLRRDPCGNLPAGRQAP